jgi:hypothetical protein
MTARSVLLASAALLVLAAAHLLREHAAFTEQLLRRVLL